MGIDTVTAFVDAVRQSRLLEPTTLDELARRAPGRFTEPRALAHHLIQKGRLTAYQVNQLFQGQGNTLVLGNYILMERLGEGGMGQVFKARHRSMGRTVALKVIRRDRLENADAVKRFRREIQAVAALHHPNIVLAFDADVVGNTHFFVMEYVDGIDLSQLVKQKGALPVGVACDFIRQAAGGLAHAHQKGMVHRDIKPSNLLLAEANGSPGVVKILDMGLARLAPQEVEDTSGASLSQDGAVLGTPDFMAPEQAKNSSKVDARADIYSLGCTFYYLLARQPPFVGGGNIEKLLKHQMDPPRPIEQFRADVPEAIRVLLLRTLAKRPEDRIQTASELADALTPFCNGNGPFLALSGSNGGPVSTGTMPLVPTAGAVTPISTPRSTRKLPVLPAKLRRVARRYWRGLVLAGAGVLLLGMGWWMVKGLFGTSTGRTTGPVASAKLPFTPREATASKRPVPTEMGHKYLPDDTGMVVTLNLAQLLKSPVVNEALRDRLESNAILMGMKGVLVFVGIDLFRDVQRLIVASSPVETDDKSCIVFYGAFNPEKFRSAADRNAAKSHEVKGRPEARFYEYFDQSAKRPTYFALVSPTALVFCSDKEHMVNCFHRAAGRPTPKLSDQSLQVLVQDLDSRPTFFAVIGSAHLRKTPGFSSVRNNPPVAAIHGGLRFVDDVAAEAVAIANRPEAVEFLRENFRRLLGNIGGLNEFFPPLIRQLSHAKPIVDENKRTVTLRHTFSADEFRGALLQKRPSEDASEKRR